MKEPLVSVVMPAYNSGPYIRQAVDSVYSQQVSLELIVVDDCSGDDTARQLECYRERADFRYIRNDTNQGAAASRNRGVSLAKGKYVAFLDSDDWWGEGKLKEQLQAMEESRAVLCSTGRELMGRDGRSTGKYIGVKPRVTYRELLKHNSINCSSVLLPTEIAREFPMCYDQSHEDYITWLKILKKYGWARGIDKPYLKCRLSEHGKSRDKWKSAKMTFQVYRYMGYGLVKSCLFFLSYAVHGVCKYKGAALPRRGNGSRSG